MEKRPTFFGQPKDRSKGLPKRDPFGVVIPVRKWKKDQHFLVSQRIGPRDSQKGTPSKWSSLFGNGKKANIFWSAKGSVQGTPKKGPLRSGHPCSEMEKRPTFFGQPKDRSKGLPKRDPFEVVIPVRKWKKGQHFLVSQ